jgi:hypothetical protein
MNYEDMFSILIFQYIQDNLFEVQTDFNHICINLNISDIYTNSNMDIYTQNTKII